MGLLDFLFGLTRTWLCRFFGFCKCKSNVPPATCPIHWQPSVLAPVFYGVQEFGAMAGPPGPCRLFFPSLDGAVFTAPILAGCTRYPLIIFCHGSCPAEAEHYKTWFEMPAALARCGYIVLVPALPEISGGKLPSEANDDLALLGAFESWMRTSWEHRDLLMPAPCAGVMGHSFGSLLAARFAHGGKVSAYASLSGVWLLDDTAPLHSLHIPKFFTWGSADSGLDPYTQLAGPQWNAIPINKHSAEFRGAAHWDYLRAGASACETARGGCSYTGIVARDLVTTFFAKYLPPECWPGLSACIPDSLIAPSYNLSFEQQFFAGGNLMGLKLLAANKACRVLLTWKTTGGQGSVTKP